MRKTKLSDSTGILIILDGFGINPSKENNAVAQAKAPVYQALLKDFPHTQIEASEKYVGLPQGFMGNSEVGHLNIGAGRVVYQDFSLISQAIEAGSFFKNPSFLDLFQKMKTVGTSATLHLMGLVSDGGVHSHLSHLFALIELAKQNAVHSINIHCFTDGRDTGPQSGIEFIREVEKFLNQLQVGRIVSVMGRFYAMDRDTRWDRTKQAYDAISSGQCDRKFKNPEQFVLESYQEGQTDEFILPGISENYSGVKSGDGIIFFNFRADRARQLTRAFCEEKFEGFPRAKKITLSGFVCMTPYDSRFSLPTAYQKTKVPLTLGEVVSVQHWNQLRVAETEKYAHVTYFFNGGEDRVFPGEKRILVPSPRDVKTYDLKPEMSAQAVTQALLDELNSGDYRFAVINFANPDMVGHTGSLSAAIRAVETVDECLGKIVEWIKKTGSFGVLTADHGNCEKMVDDQGHPLTSHTLLPVPFILIDPSHSFQKLASSGKLSDIAPTFLELWGLSKPQEMSGQSLIVHSR
ncbi:MAG: 2,3-bisphosphoglycerate-independent phosphoglycerate mutase [Proteobacteria bacterium]|nr:2,3-bisphosphoglycerate-independent phosphoglycerate mutase [Pseudomonadota bacterium]NDG27257.1 2,3-bisphosphoglycerate-independent phosphoglycerate mutase [Pseudomonadota bacterium]